MISLLSFFLCFLLNKILGFMRQTVKKWGGLCSNFPHLLLVFHFIVLCFSRFYCVCCLFPLLENLFGDVPKRQKVAIHGNTKSSSFFCERVSCILPLTCIIRVYIAVIWIACRRVLFVYSVQRGRSKFNGQFNQICFRELIIFFKMS